jgi:hypothetical protein
MGLGNIPPFVLIDWVLWAIVMFSFLHSYIKSRLKPALLIALAFIVKPTLTQLVALVFFLLPYPFLEYLPDVAFTTLLVFASFELKRLKTV